ncbi:DUF58 domain-containing protein [Massilia sp. CF038]|uniref:DUF58 domain-containing protein n=1 Tax=Massilia sp. CF038 TaxID=1881045 RepID=UPI000920DA05|nr:DUF58 domain-containing protein [Massilia sp. CF038]SHH04720.1 Uncharacterized conserved protein, DUF58 family, contains vWF domain [Massilia sp. CF038]
MADALTPTRTLLVAAGAWTALGLAASFVAPLALVWQGAGLALAVAGALDAWLSRKAPALRIERELAHVWSVGTWNKVTLKVHNDSGRTLPLDLFDDYPGEWEMEGLGHTSSIDSGAWIAVSYRLRPDKRGKARFGAPHLRVVSPLRLWSRIHRIGPETSIKIFPDFSQLLGHTLSATDRRAPTAGAVRKRRRGEGTDFRQLREYRQGDAMRSIDWKATARTGKPITREYQEERDQQVVFLLDTGRRMQARDDLTTHFDHALNAVLTLGFLAQKQGDAVGLMSFGGDTRWLAPAKGRNGLDRLLAGVYDLHPTEMAPDYTQAASDLLNRLSKRAFVVIITNLRDEDDTALRSACELISTKHLVMCASLREKVMDRARDTQVDSLADALRYSATVHYLQQRKEAIRRLGIRADRLIDITPERLSMTLVNRYLDIKESGQL